MSNSQLSGPFQLGDLPAEASLPLVVTLPGLNQPAVVLWPLRTGDGFRVLTGNKLADWPTGTTVAAVGDPLVTSQVMTEAASTLDSLTRAGQDAVARIRSEHRQVLVDIRDYVVERWHSGELAVELEDLNTFFTRFGMDPYQP
jgi:hypothetical protein